jgi:hypothetical protein
MTPPLVFYHLWFFTPFGFLTPSDIPTSFGHHLCFHSSRFPLQKNLVNKGMAFLLRQQVWSSIMTRRTWVLPDTLGAWIKEDHFTEVLLQVPHEDSSVRVYSTPFGLLVRPNGKCFVYQYEALFGFGCGNVGFSPQRTVLLY